MGGTNSKQKAEAITQSVSENISKSLAKASNSTEIDQIVKATCDPDKRNECIKHCLDTAVEIGEKDTDKIEKLCSICGCVVDGVNFTQTIFITNNNTQQSQLTQALESSVTTTLDQYKKKSSTEQAAIAATNSLTRNSAEIIQNIASSTKAIQILEAENSWVKGVTLDQSVNLVNNLIQENDTFITNVNKIATTITQKSVDTLNWVIYAGIIMVILFFIIFMIIMLTKSKDLVEFFYKILPLLIFIVIATVITVVHILVKPGYVSYTMKGEKEKRIDVGKLLMYLFLYYLGLGLIIWGVYKVKNKYTSSPEYLESSFEPESLFDDEL